MGSRKEIRDSVLNTTRQTNAQIGDLVNEFINYTLHEINDPGWAFPNKDYSPLWNFLRRKTTFQTVTNTPDYLLGRDVDRVAIVSQRTSPVKLSQIRDEEFLRLVPDPTSTGNPNYYRLWETEGVSTRLAADDKIDVVSSSANDDGDSELSVSVSGYDTNGIWRTDTYALNGTTVVAGTITFVANRGIVVQKQKDTTGSITVTKNSGGTVLVVVGKDERAPKFKVISLYPIPSSAITIYLEYYTFIPELNNDSDVPMLYEKWHYIVRLGALSKVYQYLNKEQDFITTKAIYSAAVRSMVSADQAQPDLIEHLSGGQEMPSIWQKRSEDAISA
jgi:hypothetical protein